ncbi:MAG: hypothetical protein ACK5V0_12215 [Alphaproteobacteria bacterium]|jgi:hypothetical protein
MSGIGQKRQQFTGLIAANAAPVAALFHENKAWRYALILEEAQILRQGLRYIYPPERRTLAEG